MEHFAIFPGIRDIVTFFARIGIFWPASLKYISLHLRILGTGNIKGISWENIEVILTIPLLCFPKLLWDMESPAPHPRYTSLVDAKYIRPNSSTYVYFLTASCSGVFVRQNGTYTIYPYGLSNAGISVYCESNSDGVRTVRIICIIC